MLVLITRKRHWSGQTLNVTQINVEFSLWRVPWLGELTCLAGAGLSMDKGEGSLPDMVAFFPPKWLHRG